MIPTASDVTTQQEAATESSNVELIVGVAVALALLILVFLVVIILTTFLLRRRMTLKGMKMAGVADFSNPNYECKYNISLIRKLPLL
jgi:hypothetical protein